MFPAGAAAGSCTACGGMAAGIPATHSSDAFWFTDRPIFFPERAVFYLSTALGILLLFASYLPRRSKQWKDDAAVLLSALAFAAAVCVILFSFQSWYRGLLIWGLDLILCLLTLAAYVLLLMAGKKPDSGQSEPLSDTEAEQSSSD